MSDRVGQIVRVFKFRKETAWGALKESGKALGER